MSVIVSDASCAYIMPGYILSIYMCFRVTGYVVIVHLFCLTMFVFLSICCTQVSLAK